MSYRAVVVGAGGISGAWFPPLKAEGVDVVGGGDADEAGDAEEEEAGDAADEGAADAGDGNVLMDVVDS